MAFRFASGSAVGGVLKGGGRGERMSIIDIRQVLGDGPNDLPSPRPLTQRPNTIDIWFRGGVRAVALLTLLVLFLIGFFLFWKGFPAFRSQGWHFFTNTGFQTQPTKTGPPPTPPGPDGGPA